MNDLADADRFVGDELLQKLLERGRIKGLGRRQAIAEARQPGGRLGVAQLLLESRFVVPQASSGRKKSSKSRMSPATFSRSPAARITCRKRSRTAADAGALTTPARSRYGSILATFSSSGSSLHVMILERPKLFRVEAGRGLVHALKRKTIDHLLPA